MFTYSHTKLLLNVSVHCPFGTNRIELHHRVEVQIFDWLRRGISNLFCDTDNLMSSDDQYVCIYELVWSRSRDIFIFSEISDISETEQDKRHSYSGRQIANHIWAIEWHDCQ